MASWNSIPLEISYEIVGWIAFASWSISFYPQLILNFRRRRYLYLPTFCVFRDFSRSVVGIEIDIDEFFVFFFAVYESVVGLNFDFVMLNLTKHSSYMIYNVCLYFSPVIQKQYFDTYGDKQVSFLLSPLCYSYCIV